jgi:hypothetical protein
MFRVSQHLSITSLESNLFGHTICILLLSLIWRNKPRDISEPILICEEALDVCTCLNGLEVLTSPWVQVWLEPVGQGLPFLLPD